MDNIILLSDSYKTSHFKQYPPKTNYVYSYFESRGGEFDSTLFFGLQYFIRKYLEGKVVTKEKIDEAERIISAHIGSKEAFNRAGWEHILNRHDGRLPVIIKAVPEGTIVPAGNVLMTIQNTDPECYWLTNYLETLLVQVWYPTTVATLSYEIKKIILKYLEETGTPEEVDFKLHDFGFRGVSSVESAGIGGLAHLVNFKGTDTMQALKIAWDYYNSGIVGFSIPASEHSTISSWGKENELEAYKNMLESYPTGFVACVSDTYDIYNACENLWGNKLKGKIMNRDGTLIIRPDSGDPVIVILRLLEILGRRFRYSMNNKGFKVLDPHVRLIQGDGIDKDILERILRTMKKNGWSADNIAFGMGGGLLQKLNRDTMKFAFKCSNITIDGVDHEVWKEPVDCPWKKSKRGYLKLMKDEDGNFSTGNNLIGLSKNILEPVFINGKGGHSNSYTYDSFEDIRRRVK